MSTFHHSPRWRGLRLEAKRRDGWRCVRCRSKVGLEVDHIQPVERRPDLALVLDNLQTLCKACHLDKTTRERGRSPRPEQQAWKNAIAALCRR